MVAKIIEERTRSRSENDFRKANNRTWQGMSGSDARCSAALAVVVVLCRRQWQSLDELSPSSHEVTLLTLDMLSLNWKHTTSLRSYYYQNNVLILECALDLDLIVLITGMRTPNLKPLHVWCSA